MYRIQMFKRPILLSFFIFLGCGAKSTTIVPSTSPIPEGVRGTIPTRGSDCQYFFLGLIPLSNSPDTQDALEKAKANADVDVLTDVTIDQGGIYAILFSTDCVRVRGKGVPRDVLERTRMEMGAIKR